jgi:hypothetical protein
VDAGNNVPYVKQFVQTQLCKAICTNTIPTHKGDHSVPVYHPKAVNGFTWYETDHFAIDCCTASVASDNCLALKDGSKNPQQNNGKPNSATHQKDYSPRSSRLHPRDAGVVQHMKINKCNKPH